MGDGALGAVERGELRRLFEQLGLNGNEARVLLGLLELGSAPAAQVAQQCELGRTNVYPVLEALQQKRVAHQVPGPRALWMTPGRDEVVERLAAIQAERFRAVSAAAEQARSALARLVPDGSSEGLPYVHRIDTPSQVMVVFNEVLSGAVNEVLLFDRPPYAGTPGIPNPVALEVLRRGLPARSLHQAGQLGDPRWEAYRAEQQLYIDAGLRARVVDEVPMKLLVVDRRIAVVALTQPGGPEGSYPTVLVVEHPGFAEVQADSFENRWSDARPYPRLSQEAIGRAEVEVAEGRMATSTRVASATR